MTIAVVSSWYGNGQDRIGPQPDQTIDAEWILVTDQPVVSDRWRVVHEPRPELGPRMAAKLAKFRPEIYTTAETVVWMDAACRFTDAYGLERLLEWADNASIAQWPHPYRDCLFDEAEASREVWKYGHQNLDGQVAAYRAEKMPERWGLWATGVIVRNGIESDPALAAFGQQWLNEQFRWTDQDQVSEPYCLWRWGLRPRDLPGSIFGNPALGWDYTGRKW